VQRLASAPRADWREKFETLGFSFHSADGGYWDESACYQFSAGEIDEIEAAAEELHRMALAAVKHIIDEKRCADLHVAPAQAALIEQSWRADAPTLYGRFDFAYDGKGPPKLLEYNADTPRIQRRHPDLGARSRRRAMALARRDRPPRPVQFAA
jgi:glutathionylspermidine synthase